MTPEQAEAVTEARNALGDRPSPAAHAQYRDACIAAGVRIPPPLPWPKPGGVNRTSLGDRRRPTDSGRPTLGDERNDQ